MATDLSKPSFEQVVGLINIDNTTTFTNEHITLGTPTVLVEDDRNTEVMVSATQNGGYSGNISVKYNRLDLTGFSAYGEPILIIGEGETPTEVLEQFNLLYGANLDGDDIELDGVDLDGVDYVGKTVSLVAKSTSFAYIGEIDVTVKWAETPLGSVLVKTVLQGLSFLEEVELETAFTSPDMPGFNYNAANTVPTVWEGTQYTYRLDLTSQYSLVSALVEGIISSATANALVTALKYVDADGNNGANWIYSTSGSTRFSLANATVLYNGLASASDYDTNPAFKYVAVLQLASNNTAPGSPILLQYNKPIDPLEVTDPNE